MDIAKEILRESGEKCGYGGQSIIICSYPNSGHFKYIKKQYEAIFFQRFSFSAEDLIRNFYAVLIRD